jgi:hypothetical protein
MAVVTREQILINGVPVRVHGSYDREVLDGTGQTVADMEAAIIVRGRMPDNQFMQLIGSEKIKLEYMDGQNRIRMMVQVASHSSVASGTGEAAVYRHDVLFRETPESYQQRVAEYGVLPKVFEEPAARVAATREPGQAGPNGGAMTSTDPSSWGDAIRQMRGEPARPNVPEPPLTMPELVGIETVLVNLRMDALIGQLEAAGLLQPGAVDAAFRALLEDRFVLEATPLVGEAVAKRAARDVL